MKYYGLLEAMEKASISRKDFCKKMGWSSSKFSHVLSGRDKVSLSDVCNIANVLGCSVLGVVAIFMPKILPEGVDKNDS